MPPALFPNRVLQKYYTLSSQNEKHAILKATMHGLKSEDFAFYKATKVDYNKFYRAFIIAYIERVILLQDPRALIAFIDLLLDNRILRMENEDNEILASFLYQIEVKRRINKHEALTLFYKMLICSSVFEILVLKLVRFTIANFIDCHENFKVRGKPIQNTLKHHGMTMALLSSRLRKLEEGVKPNLTVFILIPIVFRININLFTFDGSRYLNKASAYIMRHNDCLNLHGETISIWCYSVILYEVDFVANNPSLTYASVSLKDFLLSVPMKKEKRTKSSGEYEIFMSWINDLRDKEKEDNTLKKIFMLDIESKERSENRVPQ